jgi:hypothetical protein
VRPLEGGRALGVISCISLFFLQTRETRPARAHARPRNKKPGAASRPGVSRSFGECAFLEDSRYASQRENGFLDAGPKTQYLQEIAATPP